VDIVDCFLQAAQGLKAMHVMGFVHCDIKPNNILRNDSGMVKVIDFGQSAKIGTVKERIQGTPDFHRPRAGDPPAGQRADRCVQSGRDAVLVPDRQAHSDRIHGQQKRREQFLLDTRIDTPQDLNPKVPGALSNLVMECISTKAQKRPAEMDQVITRLDLPNMY